jgi:opacity protein-like surface antigen
MKKVYLTLLLALLAAHTMVSAQTQQTQQEQPTELSKPALSQRWILNIHGDYFGLKPDNDDIISMFGGGVGIGYYIFRNSYLMADLTFAGRKMAQVGTFDYTTTVVSTGASTYHDDGEINLHYRVTPSILLLWAFDVRLSDKVSFVPAICAGGTMLNASYQFDPAVDDAPKLEGESTEMASVGAQAGLSVCVAPNIYLKLGYRFLYHTETEFRGATLKPLTHAVQLSIATRFGK